MNTVQLEKTVLSCFFVDPNLLKDIHLLNDSDFVAIEHQKTFANLKTFAKTGLVLDLITYTSQFRDDNNPGCWFERYNNKLYLF